MKRMLLVMLLVGCTLPKLEAAGAIDDAGVCQAIVLPGPCGDIPSMEHRYGEALPCNVCVHVACDCQYYGICRVCGIPNPTAGPWWSCDSADGDGGMITGWCRSFNPVDGGFL
jgi:hypothetical protein